MSNLEFSALDNYNFSFSYSLTTCKVLRYAKLLLKFKLLNEKSPRIMTTAALIYP
jgi:hypothetical protein